MLEYNEIKPGKFIIFEGAPYEVLSSHVFRMQQRKPVNQTKMRNLITGSVTEYSFHQNEKAGEAELEKKEAKYLYNNKGEWWFCEPKDPSKRFQLPANSVGESGKFLKPNTIVDLVLFDEKIVSVKLPIKVELKVTEAPPDVRGNTAQGGKKVVKLETGAEINVPMFVKEGDVIRINTETGEYAERV